MGTWKKVKLTSIFTTFLAVAVFAYNLDTDQVTSEKLTQIEQVVEKKNQQNLTSQKSLKTEIEKVKKEQKDSLDKTIQLTKEKEIYTTFKTGNKKLDKNLAKEFLRAAKAFGLDEYNEDLHIFISQLLYESRGYQYYPDDHRKKPNKLVVGAAGEIGIGQIMPRTAHFLIRYRMSDEDRQKIIDAGAESFDHIYNQKVYSEKTKAQVIKWLSNRQNNLTMWSYVISYYTKRNEGDLTRGLVAYNRGQGGLNKYMKNGGVPSEYIYYQAIKKIQKKIET